LEQRDTEFLEELTIELNPDPIKEVLEFIEESSQKYTNLYKLRFSIGIQTFDDQLLSKSKRNYHYNNLPWFLRTLQKIKTPNMAYSWDFIAFWKFKIDDEWTEYLWDNEKIEFFINMVKSHTFDWFSLYTLEVFPWSDRHNEANNTAKAAQKVYWNPDNVIDEFHFLRKFIENYWYNRYEISNFALMWKESLHNMVYRNHWSYLWLWINSSSYLSENIIQSHGLPNQAPGSVSGKWVRFKNTTKWNEYLDWKVHDKSTEEILSAKEFLWEQWLLQLRTTGIKNLDSYVPVLSSNWESLLETWQKEWLCEYSDKELLLTVKGMNVYNWIITDLLNG